MPGTRKYTAGLEDRAEFRVKGDLESRIFGKKKVYFTDQSPDFRIEVKNLTENPLVAEFSLYISYQDSEMLETKDFQIAIPGKKTEERDFEVELLPYQGNVVIGLLGEFPNSGLMTSPDQFVVLNDQKTVEYIMELRDEVGFVEHLVRKGSESDPSADDDEKPSDTEIPLYTFQVFDREFYSVNHFRPRIAQYVSAVLAVLIIAVGVLQLI